jgi:hypothetical protein
MEKKLKSVSSRYLICYICNKPIFAGESWSHDPKTDKTGHFSCVYKRST